MSAPIGTLIASLIYGTYTVPTAGDVIGLPLRMAIIGTSGSLVPFGSPTANSVAPNIKLFAGFRYELGVTLDSVASPGSTVRILFDSTNITLYNPTIVISSFPLIPTDVNGGILSLEITSTANGGTVAINYANIVLNAYPLSNPGGSVSLLPVLRALIRAFLPFLTPCDRQRLRRILCESSPTRRVRR